MDFTTLLDSTKLSPLCRVGKNLTPCLSALLNVYSYITIHSYHAPLITHGKSVLSVSRKRDDNDRRKLRKNPLNKVECSMFNVDLH